MARPHAPKIELTDDERTELERRVRSHKASQREALRARIVLLAAEGETNQRIARRLQASRQTVVKWRTRFARAPEGKRIDALEDAPRSGRPRRFSPSADGPDHGARLPGTGSG